jgi:hypothetical protein
MRRVPLSGPNARKKLSGSADALFQRFGYTGVSIRGITSSVDIPKGAFYRYCCALRSVKRDLNGIVHSVAGVESDM